MIMINSEELHRWQCFVDQNIPIVAQMGLRFKQIKDQCLLADAPLDANINDKGTVFGGSSVALMTVCGWSLIKFNLEQRGITNDVVIGNSEIRWLRPQYDDLQLVVSGQVEWSTIIEQLRANQRVQKQLISCQVIDNDEKICAKMTAKYVILPAV